MDVKVLIAESAMRDLGEIVKFVAQDDAAAAVRLGNKLLDRALSLATMPQRFPLHARSRGIRKMVAAPFLIYYTCDEQRHVVNVLHFWHSARQTPQL